MTGKRKLLALRTIFFLLVVVVILPLLPLWITGRWDWWEAWFYAITWILAFAVSRALAARRHVDLLEERARMLNHANAKAWDKLLSPLVGFGAGLTPLIVGLDALSGSSAAFSLPVKIAGMFFLLAGYTLSSHAFIVNRFFSSVVRIQTERGHQVVSSGPYAWLRHPGYAGSLLAFMAAPFLLDSAWALLTAILISAVLVVRTRLEDETLQAELPGYREYAQRVRYRLLPGIW